MIQPTSAKNYKCFDCQRIIPAEQVEHTDGSLICPECGHVNQPGQEFVALTQPNPEQLAEAFKVSYALYDAYCNKGSKDWRARKLEFLSYFDQFAHEHPSAISNPEAGR